MRADEQLAEAISEFYDDPLGYVMFVFPWEDSPMVQKVELEEPWASKYGCKYGPDKWACEFLDQLGHEIKDRKFNGRDPVAPIKFTTVSGHGIGKSTLVSWLIQFILDTRPYSMGVVTANTGDQLRTKTWAEVAKWHALSITSHWWDYSNSRGNMSLSRKGSKDVKQKWRCDALTSRAENAESFQGLHSASSTSFYIFDEASGIEDAIWEARIGGATDGEPMSFDFGNPTRKSGYFYENCVGRYKDRFIVRQIDSRDVKITNKPYFKTLADDYGEDSDLFKVKVKGEFPRSGTVQFIANELVADAMLRKIVTDNKDPLIIGVDVARFGENDTVIFPRIGMDADSFPFERYNGLDNTQVVDRIIAMIHAFRLIGKECKALFVDGGGMGSGPVDILRRLGYNPVDVNFGGKSSDRRYRLKGDEMWANLRDALPRMALPDDQDLMTQLTAREYDLNETTGKIQLESKKMMMDRLNDSTSPDIADALCLTFAHEVGYDMGKHKHLAVMVQHEYDPFDPSHLELI